MIFYLLLIKVAKPSKDSVWRRTKGYMSAPQKTIEVEATAEGPKVKAKRPMSEAQLAALKKGREKLAEKRKQQEQEQEQEKEQEQEQEKPQEVTKDPEPEDQEDEGAEPGYHPLCAIM